MKKIHRTPDCVRRIRMKWDIKTGMYNIPRSARPAGAMSNPFSRIRRRLSIITAMTEKVRRAKSSVISPETAVSRISKALAIVTIFSAERPLPNAIPLYSYIPASEAIMIRAAKNSLPP